MRKILIPVAIMAFGIALNSCKTTSNKNIEYVTEPITEAQTFAEKDSVPEQKQRLKGEWIILKALGKDVNSMDDRAYLDFNAKESKIYGFTGCNYINSGFKIEGDNNISFSDIITTTRHCDAVGDEQRVLKGMENASSFIIYKRGGLYYLDIKSKDGKITLHTKRHNADVLTGTWEVSAVYGKSLESAKRPVLVIDIPELKLHGNIGCNIINGTIGLDRNKDWFVQFQEIISTRQSCDKETMDMERDLLVSLEEVEYIDRKSYDEVVLRNKDRHEVVALKRINISANK